MFIKLIKMLFPLFLICYTAVPEGRRYPGDYHLPRIKPGKIKIALLIKVRA